MKLQLPHFRRGFGVTPNAGSAISAFYVASVYLVQWLGFGSHAEQNFIDLASTWAPGQDLANPDQWSAPILLDLKQAQPRWRAVDPIDERPQTLLQALIRAGKSGADACFRKLARRGGQRRS